MFERLELKFEEKLNNGHFFILEDFDLSKERKLVKGTLDIAYDPIENKTYCYYSDFSMESQIKFDFILEGKSLVEELENTNFRNWSPLCWCDRGASVEWTIEYNDKNKQSEYIGYNQDVPEEFHDFIMILDKYFKKARLSKLKELQYTSSFNETIETLIKRDSKWHANLKILRLLKKITSFIKIFENQTTFGRWEPSENTPDFYSSDNYFFYSEDVINFRDIIRSIDELVTGKKELYSSLDLSLLPEIDEFKKREKECLIDNRMAILFLIKYMYEYCNSESSTSYKFDKALKDGTILTILNFIKEYNHFK